MNSEDSDMPLSAIIKVNSKQRKQPAKKTKSRINFRKVLSIQKKVCGPKKICTSSSINSSGLGYQLKDLKVLLTRLEDDEAIAEGLSDARKKSGVDVPLEIKDKLLEAGESEIIKENLDKIDTTVGDQQVVDTSDSNTAERLTDNSQSEEKLLELPAETPNSNTVLSQVDDVISNDSNINESVTMCTAEKTVDTNIDVRLETGECNDPKIVTSGEKPADGPGNLSLDVEVHPKLVNNSSQLNQKNKEDKSKKKNENLKKNRKQFGRRFRRIDLNLTQNLKLNFKRKNRGAKSLTPDESDDINRRLNSSKTPNPNLFTTPEIPIPSFMQQVPLFIQPPPSIFEFPGCEGNFSTPSTPERTQVRPYLPRGSVPLFDNNPLPGPRNSLLGDYPFAAASRPFVREFTPQSSSPSNSTSSYSSNVSLPDGSFLGNPFYSLGATPSLPVASPMRNNSSLSGAQNSVFTVPKFTGKSSSASCLQLPGLPSWSRFVPRNLQPGNDSNRKSRKQTLSDNKTNFTTSSAIILNFPSDVIPAAALKEICSCFGKILEVKVNPGDNFACVKFEKQLSAEKFSSRYDGKSLGGNTVHISLI